MYFELNDVIFALGSGRSAASIQRLEDVTRSEKVAKASPIRRLLLSVINLFLAHAIVENNKVPPKVTCTFVTDNDLIKE